MYYKREVVWFVERQVELGRKRQDILKNLKIKSSTYHGWKKQIQTMKREEAKKIKKPSPLALTPAEKQLILDTKAKHPTVRYRKIQGILQMNGTYLSPSSVYKVLKENGLVEDFERRESPWKKPRYSVRAKNLVWGCDWTKVKINYTTWHLLTVIDFFSRKIIAWDILPTVQSQNIKDIYRQALLAEGLTQAALKPKLRVDQGSPNTARVTKAFFIDMAFDLLSLARVRRPTDNAITERFYGSIKQEEIYLVGSYPDETSARREISLYMSRYNEQRPHQALWNYTPNVVHEVNNKSEILADLEAMKFESKSRRREYWTLASEMEFQQKMIAMLKGGPYSEKLIQN